MSETLAPEDLSESGKAAFEAGEFQRAAELFQAAADGFRQAGQLIDSAEMNNNLSVALLHAGEAEAALQAVDGTPEFFGREGDRRRQAMAFGNQGAALAALDRPDEAEAAYQESAALLRDLGEDELHASVMRAVSELQLKGGRHLEAVASMQTGLDGIKKPKLQQRMLRRLLKMPFKLINRS